MSKGSKRRPGEGYRDNYDQIFGKAQLTDEQGIVGSVADAMLAGCESISTEEYRARAKKNYEEGLNRILVRKLHHPLCNMFVPGKPSYGAAYCEMCMDLEKEFSNCKDLDKMLEQVGCTKKAPQ